MAYSSCSSEKKSENKIETGKVYKVNQQIMGAYTEPDYELMKKYAAEKDIDSYNGLYSQNKAVILNEGDQCTAIEADAEKTKCACENVQGKKDTVWVTSEYLTLKPMEVDSGVSVSEGNAKKGVVREYFTNNPNLLR